MNRTRPRRAVAGFTLVELLIAVGVAGVLSSVAYPSFTDQVHRARRSDALVALVQVQAAQERWRAGHRDYADMAALGLPAVSPAGHYRMEVHAPGDDHYEVLAIATGAQARDAACRHLRLVLDGANLRHASGPDADTTNPPAANRRCWAS